MTACWQLALPIADDIEEGVTNFLWEHGALGVVVEDADGAPWVRAFFAGYVDGDHLQRLLGDYLTGLRALGFPATADSRVSPVADVDWAEAWREHFRPVTVGRRLLVAPPWAAAPVPERLTIVIEPGRAFGTGHHGSTVGCLETLEAVAAATAPAAAIDVGTGSGILAIAAARMGVSRVLAVDDDPDAVRCATANAARNGVADRVECRCAEAGALEIAPAPLVMANLLSAAHLRLAPSYERYVARGGALLLGGILDGEADAVGTALARHGFTPAAARSVEGWTTLELARTR